ncbi:putative Holliday junction resolvase [Stella humosa]|uniref:Putative pre-16S rRNA nuclease n=1 Tax=Stella humosa TaxID=94 RepID=A0A3N1KQV9_9PROT|nr:Holliday junction resolvase RuvX [Stella humosa]ROP81179.1 putative Holliday junction resolvase [Stella humosa]BBK32525.1 putative pre-16S rRNA nuclease [Stella humosa]
MAIVQLAELAPLRAGPARLLGLDVGTKTVGLALSDTRLVIATPMETIRRAKFQEDAARLADIVRRQGVGGLVVGLPIGMDGRENPRSQSVRAFVRNLLAVIDLPAAMWDERLSTAAVERAMIAADMTRSRRAEAIDRAAAAYILQGALDALAHVQASAPEA